MSLQLGTCKTNRSVEYRYHRHVFGMCLGITTAGFRQSLQANAGILPRQATTTSRCSCFTALCLPPASQSRPPRAVWCEIPEAVLCDIVRSVCSVCGELCTWLTSRSRINAASEVYFPVLLYADESGTVNVPLVCLADLKAVCLLPCPSPCRC